MQPEYSGKIFCPTMSTVVWSLWLAGWIIILDKFHQIHSWVAKMNIQFIEWTMVIGVLRQSSRKISSHSKVLTAAVERDLPTWKSSSDNGPSQKPYKMQTKPYAIGGLWIVRSLILTKAASNDSSWSQKVAPRKANTPNELITRLADGMKWSACVM